MRISLWFCLFQQGLCSLAILCASGRWCGLPRISRLRRMLASLLGGSLCTLGLMGSQAIRLGCLVLMLLLPFVCWPRLAMASYRRLLWPMLLMAALLSGLQRLAGQWLPSFGSLALCLLLLLLLPAWQKRQPQVQYTVLYAEHDGRRLRCTALIDSGNLLTDGITGLPVIVISPSAARSLVALPAPGQLLNGMRYLHLRTAAGPASMIIFHPDRITLSHQGRTMEVCALLGVSPAESAGFTALVPARLLSSSANEAKEGTVYDHDL